jgi:hypothetical protein
MKQAFCGLPAVVLCYACQPVLPDEAHVISTPTLLAINAEPPEGKPGSLVSYRAFVATPEGNANAANALWRFCLAPKALTENNSVSADCLDDEALVLAGVGTTIDTTLPSSACTLFGPEALRGGYRARDPDETGGYYQPLRLDIETHRSPAFHLSRVQCSLASASAETALLFSQTYRPNQNPHLQPMEAAVGGRALSLDGIPAGADVQFQATWPAADSETYAYFDPSSQTVITRREAMQLAWFASAGSFSAATTGCAEDDEQTTLTNHWLAPAEAGPVHVWLVLRDSRGGGDYGEAIVTVVP